MSNSVYIGTSLDGFIADRNDEIEWLDCVPVAGGDDLGYNAFISEIDALVMGRITFETVLGFKIDWPYELPVFVLSTTLESIPKELEDRVFLVGGAIPEVLENIHSRGYQRLYVDGGRTVQSFLALDLIDELIVSTLPILLGGGAPLFGMLPDQLMFEHVSTEVLADQIVKSRYRRKR